MTRMTDDQMLDLLANDAPAPPTGFAKRLLRRGHRAVMVRRTALLAGVAVSAAVIIAVPLSLGGSDTPNSTQSTSVAPRGGLATREALVYEATVHRVLTKVDRQDADIAILDRLCLRAADPELMVTLKLFGCDGEPWPADLRSELEHLLSEPGRVQWVDERADLSALVDPSTPNTTVFFVFGPAALEDDGAELGWSILELPTGGGRGETDSWTWQEDRWTFTGTGDEMWID
jgi:hypothetical protein